MWPGVTWPVSLWLPALPLAPSSDYCLKALWYFHVRPFSGYIQFNANEFLQCFHMSLLSLFRYGVTPENIILYGQSIGTVPTIDLAARYECAAVILHSPLMSGLRVAFPDTRKTYCFDAFPRWVLQALAKTWTTRATCQQMCPSPHQVILVGSIK